MYKHTGQKIFFRGADDPLKIKSIKPERGYIGITWFEELDQFDGEEEIRNILQSTNRGGSVFWNFFSFNPPKSRDNWANQYAEQIRDDRLTVHSTYLDVPVDWLGEQFFIEAEILKSQNPKAYEHEYLGVATGTGGAVFDNVSDITAVDVESKLGSYYYGIDFGFAVDPFCWLKVAYDRARNDVYILDEIYQVQLSNRRAAELIKAKQSPTYYITADNAEPKSISELNEYGLKVIGAKKGVDSVHYGIVWLQHCAHIYIDKRKCPNAYREFTCYEYDTDRYGNFISRYPDKDNHAIDCCRYSLNSFIMNRTVKTIEKSKLGVY
jgi:PBSX family phage terminase large subunit